MSYSIDTHFPALGRVATLRFADPERHNQLCWGAVDELASEARRCREAGARFLILASALPGHWLQHAWLDDLQAGLQGDAQTGTGEGWFGLLEELTHPDLISIAAISGDCSGGGAELAWACDLRVAERQARFCQPEVQMGLTTGIGGCSRLLRLVGPGLATELVYTGQAIDAGRLYRHGAINRLVDAGHSQAAATALAEQLAAHAPEALSGLKRSLAAAAELPLGEALAREQDTFQAVAGHAASTARLDAARRACASGGGLVERYGELPEQSD